MKQTKTNAIRLLEQHKKPYTLFSYQVSDGKIDGQSVAQKINKPEHVVYKTLVAQGKSGAIYVALIPVNEELHLKKLQKVTAEKKVNMLLAKQLHDVTNYVRGGCSPIGMKKPYPTFIDSQAAQLDTIVVNAGKVGLQMELRLSDLVEAANAQFAELTI
ncbi:Cys-tRNA(Pro) deacylase [Alkalihalobacillus clausii]|jgi:Cys-tRNA(Pro)/Cys-tRNA(Cys) deacylase|uniref:Cys-tRNA(Pro) deacylase n=1 Tax=Shouchella clausii TaxID=79880 RepID=UPI000BA76F5E|nr:Cys-tRNA(Pro) deacylase [Shouchella clausii]MCM3548248.1 Cys-tRNA(Pro) deacylase [Shouchella clausii]PAF13291.1 Cys-tRNA(Pro) deacylase [Shouchella clausii]